MDIDSVEAAALGWPKTKYAGIERERRWLCKRIPADLVSRSSIITDIYLSGTQLRLREVRDLASGAVQLKLARKADISPSKRIITTIYLSRWEFSLLCQLPGDRIEKTRHTVSCLDGAVLAIDKFGAGLSGLLLAEAEFSSDDEMNAFAAPDFLGLEVTGEQSYTGGSLATVGIPAV